MPSVLLLHGWPGGPSDYRRVVPLLDGLDLRLPEFVGFGAAFEGEVPEGEQTAGRHAERLREFISAEGLDRPVLAGYDVGSRVGQAFARRWPEELSALVCTPAYPGVQAYMAEPRAAKEFWYQHLNRLPLLRELADGRPDRVAAYLRHFWSHWADDDTLASGPEFDGLVAAYSRPGALWASTAWYRDNTSYDADAPVTVPTTMLWPRADPLFPTGWADRVDEWFTDVELRPVDGGHFVPLEAAEAFADAVRARAGA